MSGVRSLNPTAAGMCPLREIKKNKKMLNNNNIEVGRFVVSPMTQPRDGGGFTASVSIRSGRGMASVDRVMWFTPEFRSPQAALHYARSEGLAWARCH
ncbi:hypothetical protein [Roseateles sp.]|uniref:hypothetical protein n=1 Tax=Roseateles sp. TaxID=1971397 RepID=UPI003BAD9795